MDREVNNGERRERESDRETFLRIYEGMCIRASGIYLTENDRQRVQLEQSTFTGPPENGTL